MDRKEKFSIDFKLECIRLVLEEYESIESVSRKNGFNVSNLRKWISFYGKYGISGLKSRKYTHYTPDFKLEVLKNIELKNLSQREACVKFDIPAQSTILNWQRDYEKSGILGLQNKPRGRPPTIMTYKRKKTKTSKPLTREEELLVENEKLRAENDYLKKLDALILASKKHKPLKN